MSDKPVITTEWRGEDLIIHYEGRQASGDLRIERIRYDPDKTEEVVKVIAKMMGYDDVQ